MPKYYDMDKMPKNRYCSHCKCITLHSYGKEEIKDIGDGFIKIILPIKCNTCQDIQELTWTQKKVS